MIQPQRLGFRALLRAQSDPATENTMPYKPLKEPMSRSERVFRVIAIACAIIGAALLYLL